jgi:hypothetical protein
VELVFKKFIDYKQKMDILDKKQNLEKMFLQGTEN